MQTTLFDNEYTIDVSAFWDKINWSDIHTPPDALFKCWPWQGATNRAGYGRHSALGKGWYAHRLSYFLLHGQLPPVVMHRCDNPACANCFHLVGGTRRMNMLDRDRKGRQAKGSQHGLSKLTEEEVLEIWSRKGNVTQTKLANEYGVSQTTIGNIFNGKTWKHLL